MKAYLQALPSLLRLAQRRADLTLRELGDALGVEPPTVMRWLNGTARPPETYLDDISVAFELTADERVTLVEGWLSWEQPVEALPVATPQRYTEDLDGDTVPVLRCATLDEYADWLGRKARVVQEHGQVLRPSFTFCYDAEAGWCRAQRTAGRCCRTDAQFAGILARQRQEAA